MLNTLVSIESLILANHVEVVNGLLYVSGGGWTTHTRIVQSGNTPPQSQLGIALLVSIPWHQTNQEHQMIIDIRDEDANSVGNINAKFNVGRGPNTRPGTTQYFSIAAPLNCTFPRPGGYEIVAHIEGVDGSERRWAFEIKDVALVAG